MTWTSGGRLTSLAIGAGQSTALAYGPTDGRLASLTHTQGPSTLGAFTYDWDPSLDRLQARQVGTAGLGLTGGQGWRFTLDTAHRLIGAIAGQGSLADAGQGSEAPAFTFTYGLADELLTTQDPALGTTIWQNGPLGRPTGRTWTGGSASGGSGDSGGSGSGTLGPGSEIITYDALGRRIADARFTYTWDWRGRLLRLTVKDPQPDGPGATSAAAFAGHQLRYGYDALGRLTDRTHLGIVPNGGGDDDRPFIDRRRFLWDGDTLLTELGINFEGAPLWRATHLPGPTGLDDAPLVRIERISPAGADSLVTILRDELGTTEAILSGEDLLGRILATPYGDTALERGPEPRHVRFDATRTQADSQSQTPSSGHIPGALILATSLPLDGATLAAGVHLQRWQGQWLDLGPTAVELEGSDLIVLPLQGWPADTSCRLVLDATITDAFTRAVRLPDTGATGFDVALDVPASGSPTFERSWSAFDSIRTASSTLDGALPGGVTSLFHGMWTDPVSGIAYARARWYDPSRGTWLAEDPIGAVDSPNLYAYVGLRPYSANDPLGMESGRTFGAMIENREVQRALIEQAAADRESCQRDPMSLACLSGPGRAALYLFGDPPGARVISIGVGLQQPLGAILFVNGIRNTEADARAAAEALSRHTKRPVSLIWNPTFGKSFGGSARDVGQVVLINKPGIADETTRMVVNELRSGLECLPGDGYLDIVGHSQGAAIVSTALSYLSEAERSRINLTTYGEAAVAYPAGLHRVCRVSNVLDLIPNIAGGGTCPLPDLSQQQFVMFWPTRGEVFPHGLDLYLREEEDSRKKGNGNE